MQRRRFLSLLAAAFMTPPEFARAAIAPKMPVLLPPKVLNFVAYEQIGISICNPAALAKLKFDL